MALILALDVAVIAWLLAVAFSKGFESALPVAAFLFLVFPNEARIQLPGFFDLTTQRVVVLVLCGLFFALGRDENLEEVQEPFALRVLLACLVGWMLVSSAESVVPAISFKSTLSQYFDFCTVFMICLRSIRSREALCRILAGVVAGMAVCCICGLVEVYGGWKVTSLFPAVVGRFADLEGLDTRGVRMQSTFSHSILFGSALAMTIPLALYLLSIEVRTKNKVFLWTALAAMLLCIYKTGSRGPWLAIIIALIFLGVMGRGQLRKFILIIALCTVVVVLARPGIRDTLVSLYGATADEDSAQGESYRWRYVLYHIASQELARSTGRSLWGYGPESFYYLGLTTEFSLEGEMHTVKVESCDSAVVELLMDTGYIGFALVVAFICAVALLGFRGYLGVRRESESPFPALFASLLAFCFLMTNVELFGWGQQTYLLWIILALIVRNSDEEVRQMLGANQELQSGQTDGWGALVQETSPQGQE